jgi:hypothetical protein
MRGEDGQASVEWIGLVLLVGLALAALTRLAPDAEGRSLASTLLHAVAPPQVAGIRSEKRHDSPPPGREAFTAPPPVPPPSELRLRARRRVPRELARGWRRGAALAWRRAWLGCLAYERARYAYLHPESRFPGHTIRRSEVVRIANDCLSPVDLVRDWTLLTGR